MSAISLESEQTGTMKHGRDLDDVISEAVDDSIVAVNDLTDRVVAKLRYDPSRARVTLEPFDDGDDPFNDKIGIPSGVTGDMGAYRLDVLDCLGRPENP